MSEMKGAVDEILLTIFERIGRFIVRSPKLIILSILTLTIAVGGLIPQLKVNNDGRIYFIEGDPMLVAQERFEDTFGSEQFVMFFVEGEKIFTPEGFAIIGDLITRLNAVEWKDKPAFTGTLDPFHAPALKPGSGSLDFAPILDAESPTAEDLVRARELVTSHPVYARSIVNRDGSIAAIMATMQSLPDDPAYSQFVADQASDIFHSVPGLETTLRGRLVGAPVFGSEMNKVTAQESVIFGSASVLMCIFALLLMFRRVRQVMSAILVVVISTILTVGTMAFFGTEMSLIHAILPPAIIVTGLGSGIHVINEFRLLVPLYPRREALIHAVRSMGGPCFLTAVTTAVGFLAMLAAPVAPMRTLGLYIALGVLLSFLLAMFLVPAILALGKGGDDVEPLSKSRATGDKVFSRIADVVVKHAVAISIFFFVLAGALSAGISQIGVDTNFLHALRSDHPFRETVEYVDERMGGSSSMELIIDTGERNALYDPGFLNALAELQHWIETNEDDVVWVTLSVVDLFREINYAVTGKRTLPETRAAAGELLFLYEVGGGITKNVVDHDRRLVRMSARTRQMSSARSRTLEDALRKKAEELFRPLNLAPLARAAETEQPVLPPKVSPSGDGNDDVIIIEDEDEDEIATPTAFDEGEILIIDDDDAPPAPGPAAPTDSANPPSSGVADSDANVVASHDANEKAEAAVDDASSKRRDPFDGPPRFEVAGSTPLFAKLNDYVISSQLTSFSLAALIISIFMMIMLRSIRLGLAIMIPNVLPIFSTYGLMGWLGIHMDFMLSVIAVAAIGVAVDGTIHIGTRYRRARAMGEEPAEASRSVLTSVGRALVVTTLGLAAGFSVLAPSVMATLATFGKLMAFCLVLALLYDLLQTPAILTWLAPLKKR